jgi:hypothetical protein
MVDVGDRYEYPEILSRYINMSSSQSIVVSIMGFLHYSNICKKTSRCPVAKEGENALDYICCCEGGKVLPRSIWDTQSENGVQGGESKSCGPL